MDGLAGMVGSLALDDRTVRKTISAAKNGSLADLKKLPELLPNFSPELVTEAITMFCSFLDVPSFNPDKPLSNALAERRGLALAALASIGNISDILLTDPKATVHGVIQRNWPKILNWMRYFYYEVTTGTTKSDIFATVITIISAVVMKVARNRVLFERALMKDNLIELIVKDWLKTDDSPPFEIAHRYRIVVYLYEALAIMDEKDEQRTAINREMILREAGGDARVVTKRLMRHLKNPAKASKECYQIVLYTVGIAVYLAIQDRSHGSPTAFMDSFLKDDLVLLITQLLGFLAEDVARPRKNQVFPEDTYLMLIPHCIRILGCCVRSRNGPHWATVMLKNGFLRAIAGIVAFPQYLEICQGGILEVMINHDIPQYFCHRMTVVAAIKAAKEITEDGSVKKLESSHIKDAWAHFENILLERTAFNAIYGRDFAERDILQCLHCHKDKLETHLFKCAGCNTAVYCSKECQTAAWKTGGHRTQCKSMRDAWYHSGMKQPTDDFLYALALCELRRHTPGIRQQIKSEENPNGIPAGDAFFIVSYAGFLPPCILVKSGQDVLNTPGQKEETRGVMQHVLDMVRKGGGTSLPLQVQAHRGGHIPTITAHLVPSNILNYAMGVVHAGDEKIPYLSREPARSAKTKKNLPFVLDEVDFYMMDARKNFRPPKASEGSSAKTIYHHVEEQVARNAVLLPGAFGFGMRFMCS